jgi:glycosyltransferase involved in cell wall biosynthesis
LVSDGERLNVVHLVDAAGGSDQLWGKERVVHWLMEAQRSAGNVLPRLATLTNKRLTEVVAGEGFETVALTDRDTKDPRPYVRALRNYLCEISPSVVHTHGYKANLLGRAARWAGVPMRGLVGTCHGWVDTSRSLRLYNMLDRWTSASSDAVTVPSPTMLGLLGKNAHFIPNGIHDRPAPDEAERARARESLRIPPHAVVAGTLGRLSAEKGIDVLLSAARHSADVENLLWLVAGTGPLEEELRKSASDLPQVRFVGYVDGSQQFLPAIDIFVQPSWSEGLSLALLEATRSALPIVATRVGATEWAVRHEVEAYLVSAGESEKLAEFVSALARSGDLRQCLGMSARRRFDDALNISAMQRRYHELYESVANRRANQK